VLLAMWFALGGDASLVVGVVTVRVVTAWSRRLKVFEAETPKLGRWLNIG
jgi:hypothetical protein